MDCILNDFELKKPPLVTINVSNTTFAKEIYLAINRYLTQLKEPDAVEFEQAAALLSRLMARRKNSFHGMIGFRSVRKLNAALCRLLRLDMPRELEQLRGALPDIYDDAVSGEMPTGNCFEFVLVRLLSVHALHERIRACCLKVAEYFGKVLSSNFFMEFTTLIIAVVAKLNKLSGIMDTKCVQLYNQLQPKRKHFPTIKEHTFLPDEVELPTKLEVKLPKALMEATAAVEESIVDVGPSKAPNMPKVVKKVTDVGQTIQRKQKPQPQQDKAFSLDQLQTVKDVKRFIAFENKARQSMPTKCTTKGILKHEWLAAQKLFERKVQAQEAKKGLSIFIKFISSKI